jgi:hypothetical protein
VRPERVYVWPADQPAAEPRLFDAHIEEVRSGHSEEPDHQPAPPAGGSSVWDRRIFELGERYRTAAARWIAIGPAPAGLPLAAGRACLTAHRHDEDFSWQENFQVRGDLVAANGAWVLVPRRLVGGFELPASRLALVRANAARARRYHRVAKRELARRG